MSPAAGTATAPAVYVVPVHDCRAESVQELDGWRFDGYRCRYCLRRTAGPVKSTRQEPAA